MMLIICAIIFVGVFGVMFYSIIMHRKSRGAVPAKFHEHVGIEIAWTVIPFLMVLGMALPATLSVVSMYDRSAARLVGSTGVSPRRYRRLRSQHKNNN